MSCIRFEQLGQAIVINLGAGQRPADVLGHVTVAEADRVWVPERCVPHLGRGPYPDPRYGAQPPLCLVTGQVHALFQPARSAHSPDDRRGPRAIDPGPQPLPGRDQSPSAGTGGNPQPSQATLPRCQLAVPADKGAIRTRSLLASDLLRDDRGDYGLQHQPCAGHSPSAETPCRLRDLPMVGHKASHIIQVAKHARHRREGPLSTRTPCGGLDAGRGDRTQAERRRALRGADATPDGAVGVTSEGRVAPAQMQTTGEREHVQRPPGRPKSMLALSHRSSMAQTTRRWHIAPARRLACVRTPASVLSEILHSDPARPRVTFYEDTAGPTRGERIELSGKVLANWVSKAGNALQDEYGLGPGSVVRLSLPPHWRAVYWAFAVWSVGATVDLAGSRTADLLICDDPEVIADTLAPTPGEMVLVTLDALARAHRGPMPAGAMDEARELATYGDQFVALADPGPDDLALVTDRAQTPYRNVVPQPDWPPSARVSLAGDLSQVLESTLAAWAGDGSVVLARDGLHAGGEPQPGRLASERVTLDLA
jgi:uncharacterized protein (TIGR03089 family)